MNIDPRTYLAGCALQGLLANECYTNTVQTYDQTAQTAMKYADAILKITTDEASEDAKNWNNRHFNEEVNHEL